MKNWTRRQVLKGAGIALSLPWLETLAPRKAKAASSIKRYLSLYFPNGAATQYWTPTGSGTSLTLSPILQPLQPNISKVLVLGGIGNYSPWGKHIEPSHGNNSATAWTGVAAHNVPQSSEANFGSSISVDQTIANLLATQNNGKSPTPLASLQVGLSTLDSYTDGLPGPHSRSISWKSESEPLYKTVSPASVFSFLMSGGFPSGSSNMSSGNDAATTKLLALKKSSLDYIIESSNSLKLRLSRTDNVRVDQFLSSVQTLESKVMAMKMPSGTTVVGCSPPSSPPTQNYNVGSVPPDYDRGVHAGLMIDLVVLAFQCDMTRVISFMLDDARSDYAYTFLKQRTWTATSSAPSTTNIASGYHALQHTSNPDTDPGFATMQWWMADRANELVTKISAITDGNGGSAMDNTVIHFMSGMHGGNHDGLNLPVVLLGSGGGVLKQGQFLNFPGTGPMGTGKNLQDVHLTIINSVFNGTQAQFGKAVAPFAGTTGVINELHA
ncbi:MAG TPA: DUF1552 domain-containing protein [Polyangia bacterium]|nr:DUF1552 domain-containing protein [Polyangia bacterium]